MVARAEAGKRVVAAAPAPSPSRRRARSTLPPPPASPKAHNLPAYVVFHDAALAEMADLRPDSLDALGEIGGVGERKLAAYGDEILRVLRTE
jgi:hypothetical protein